LVKGCEAVTLDADGALEATAATDTPRKTDARSYRCGSRDKYLRARLTRYNGL
jgi:hypothetical protein